MGNKRSGGGLSPAQQAAKFLGVSVVSRRGAGGDRPARRRGPGPGREGLRRGIRRAVGQPQDTTAESAQHHPGRGGRQDRHRLLPRPHDSPAQGHLALHAEGDRRHRGLALLRARRDRPQGHPPRGQRERAERRRLPGRLDADPAVREERLRRGGRRRRRQGRRGHPADDRPQGPRAEVRHPDRGGAGQEGHPRELPEHHLLRAAGVRHRGSRPALLLQALPRT